MEQVKKDYRDTVLTPKTDFPMRANLPQREPERLQRWESIGLYEKTVENRAGRPNFILHDGPPYANGDIHVGHALNKTLKDVVVRYKTMKGFRSPYVPGWDCHGLPIEQQVMKQLGPKIHDMAPVEVRRLCQEYAAKYIDIQREQFKRLGILGDWENPYKTYAPEFEVAILSGLRDIVARGLVVKGKKSVHWDPIFRTALAEAEIVYKTHTSDSIYVGFPMRDPDKFAPTRGLGEVRVAIWTTTPWTIPANVAIVLHPDFEYVVMKTGETHYVAAKGLVSRFAEACKLAPVEIVREFKAAEIDRAEYDHPFFPERRGVVVLGDHVTLEAGTGAVHTAPGHGHDDFVIGVKYGLPCIVPVDERGRFTDEYPDMQGENVFEANPKIIEKLRESGHLIGSMKIEHEYPHSWRSHQPIVFRATEQWFMELEEIRARAIKAIDEEVQWIPPWGRERIHAMVENRPDWCLSRQRAWGVPIPSIRSKASGKSVLDPRFIDAFIRVVAEKGTDAWFTDPLESFWPEGFVHEPTGERSPADFDKEFDILDVWFDSGSTHLACLETNPKLSWPADLYLEGSDQHRGWFQSSLLVGVAARGSAPFKAVLTHGFVLDGKGKAMSKSAGNVISPLDLMKQLGADIIRLWVCSEDYRGDVRVSREILERVGEAYRRIRNALRFLIGNLHDFDAARDRVAPERLEEIDRWILSRLANLVEQVDRAYANYEFHRVYHLVHGFCVFELSAVYLDVVKDRLYCSAANDATRRAAQTALDELFGALVRLVAPILVFTADEAWEFAGGEGESVHLSDMPIPAAGRRDRELEAKWDSLLELREEAAIALEEARRAKTIGHSLDAAVQIAPADREESEFLSANLSLLKTLLIVSHLRVGPKSQPTAAAPQPGEGSDALSEGGAASRWRVAPAQGEKCERCWMKDPLVGRDVEHPTLCSRCCEVMRTLESEGFPHKQGR